MWSHGMRVFFFFSSRRRHTRYWRDWSSDVCSSDLVDVGVESMDTFEGRGAASSALEAVAGRERLREIVGDVHNLPESQRSALILREFDALSYQEIADTMDTTIPAVKSLLVRARIGLASAAQERAEAA